MIRRRILTIVALCAAVLVAALPAFADGTRIADAAMNGDGAQVRALLTGGEDVNAAQGDGMTALHWASRRGDLDVVKMLLAAGANVRAITRLGNYTPLLLVSEMGHGAVIDALTAAGADAKATTASGVTPLMLASASGQVGAVTTLLARGADVNAAEPTRGETAIMFAAANRRTDVVRALIAAKADVNAATKVVSLKTAPPSPEEEAYLAAVAAGRASGAGGAPAGGRQGRQGAPATADDRAPGTEN